MSLYKSIELPNGIIGTHHKILSIKTKPDLTVLEVQIGSWTSETLFNSNVPPIWNHYLEVPILGLINSTETKIKYLEPFINSETIPEVLNLESEKYAKWLSLKAERNIREYEGFMWDGSTFDSDPISQSRIQGGVQLAQLAIANGQPFTISWTLLDNTVRELDETDMIQVGLALAQHIQNIHGKSRKLRILLDFATTSEEVSVISWSENISSANKGSFTLIGESTS